MLEIWLNRGLMGEAVLRPVIAQLKGPPATDAAPAAAPRPELQASNVIRWPLAAFNACASHNWPDCHLGWAPMSLSLHAVVHQQEADIKLDDCA